MTAMVWLNKPPATPCLGEPQIASNVHSIQAMKVCRSTLGRPSIKFTGISMVPARYKDDGRYATRLRVDRFEIGPTSSAAEYIDTATAKPGCYIEESPCSDAAGPMVLG